MTKSLTNQQIQQLYQQESRYVLATLIRVLGDFELAEEGMHEAFSIALKDWPEGGWPDNPRAWLISTGRFRMIDQLCRQARWQTNAEEILNSIADDAVEPDAPSLAPENIEDDRLRLIFTCCHPSLAPEAQLALTLREVCGLTTEAIASAFLTKPSTLAQRIVRAKHKIRDAKIPYEIPERQQLPERLQAVLQTIYLIFNEGYSASSGDAVHKVELSEEAIYLGRELHKLLPETEVAGLLALMLLHHSRHRTRTNQDGDLVLLADQDRSQWDRALIEEGMALTEAAFSRGNPGPYALQAAIAALHAEADSAPGTDWQQIVGLYDLLITLTASPIVELNRAVALAMLHGPEAGLEQLELLSCKKQLENYHLLYAAKADFHRQLNQTTAALACYQQALQLTDQLPEQRFLQGRIAELTNI